MKRFPKAQVVPFSSVVGSSVSLHHESGAVRAILPMTGIGGPDRDTWKKNSVETAEEVAKRINAFDPMLDALRIAERFMAGFEGDELQEGVDDQLRAIRSAIECAA